MNAEYLSVNPWLSMWNKPRATIQQIIDTNPRHLVPLIAALWGLNYSLDQSSFSGIREQMDITTILGIALIAGPLGGIVSLYIYAVLLRWTGRWIGGKASAEQIRAAFAWSSVPVIWAMVLWIPLLAILGEELFAKDLPTDIGAIAGIVVSIIALVKIVTGIWSLIVYLVALGQVQGFSIWRAISNNLLVGLVLVAPAMIVALIVSEMAAN